MYLLICQSCTSGFYMKCMLTKSMHILKGQLTQIHNRVVKCERPLFTQVLLFTLCSHFKMIYLMFENTETRNHPIALFYCYILLLMQLCFLEVMFLPVILLNADLSKHYSTHEPQLWLPWRRVQSEREKIQSVLFLYRAPVGAVFSQIISW